MGTAKIAYKSKYPQISERQIASCFVSGFTGQLKNWWDNMFTPMQQMEILTHQTVIHRDVTINDEVVRTTDYESDGASYLIYVSTTY